jgi:hypothetical protein
MRLKERFVTRETILSSVDTYEIIEEYPKDKYLPSCLVYAKHEDLIIHIQIAIDKNNENIRIVTAYKPASEKWENNLKKRRKS